MKSILWAFIFILIVGTASLQAQEPPASTGTPTATGAAEDALSDAETDDDTDFVLEEARRRAGRSKKASSGTKAPTAPAVANADTDTDVSDDATDTTTVADNSAVDQSPGFFTPLAFSAVPGLSFPFGKRHSALHVGMIGSIAAPLDNNQVSGVFNISGRHTSMQVAGVFNLSEEGSDVQASGVFNISDDKSDVQAACVFNIGKYVQGIQVGGVFNINGELEGLALAGVFNISGKAKGLLLAPINIVDELDGYAIGIINIIGNGFNDLAVDYQWTSQALYASWKSGTDKFYTLVYAGVPVEAFSGKLVDTFTTGFGVGLRMPLERFWIDGEFCLENAFNGNGIFLGFTKNVKTFADYVWNAAFVSLRLAINSDISMGAVPYIGIKADICLPGSSALPEYLREGFGGLEPWVIGRGETSLEVYPKLYVGLRL